MFIYCIGTQYLVGAPFALITNYIDSLWGSGLVSLLASQAHQHHGHLTNFWCFLAVWAGAKSWLENEISIFKKAGQQKEAWSAPKFLGNGAVTLVFKNTMDQHQQMTLHPKSSHRLWKLNTDFMQLGLWASPPSSRLKDLGFQMKYKTCSHLKRGIWTTGQQSSSSSP